MIPKIPKSKKRKYKQIKGSTDANKPKDKISTKILKHSKGELIIQPHLPLISIHESPKENKKIESFNKSTELINNKKNNFTKIEVESLKREEYNKHSIKLKFYLLIIL